ncbi:MAG: DedA family protein [Deltaproteobacteria bacterium]|nr:DedA family protein [Deltaproteobacteria bacterium]
MPDLESLIRTYGYGALFVGTFLEGETVLILAGLIAHMGMMKLPLVMVVAFFGSFLGDQIFFFLGRLKGTALLDSHPSWKSRADKVHQAMRRYRNGIMLGFRFVYGMRMITPLILGMDRSIPARWFILLNLIGAAVWSVAIALVGYFLGRAAKSLLADIRHYELALLLGIILVGIAIRLFATWREKRKSS